MIDQILTNYFKIFDFFFFFLNKFFKLEEKLKQMIGQQDTFSKNIGFTMIKYETSLMCQIFLNMSL